MKMGDTSSTSAPAALSSSSNARILFSRVVYVNSILPFVDFGRSVSCTLHARLVSTTFAETLEGYACELWHGQLAVPLMALFGGHRRACDLLKEHIATNPTQSLVWLLRRALLVARDTASTHWISRPLGHLSAGSWTICDLAATQDNAVVVRLLLTLSGEFLDTSGDSIFHAATHNAVHVFEELLAAQDNIVSEVVSRYQAKARPAAVHSFGSTGSWLHGGKPPPPWEANPVYPRATEIVGGARLNAKDIIASARSTTTGDTALHVAAERGFEVLVGRLLGLLGPSAAAVRNKNGQTPLGLACARGNTPIVKSLLATMNAADVNIGAPSPFLLACSRLRLDTVRALLEYNAERKRTGPVAAVDINAMDRGGNTPLIAAILAGSSPAALELVRMLLDNGASIAAVNSSGFNALTAALYMNATDICDAILDLAEANGTASSLVRGWRSTMFSSVTELLAERVTCNRTRSRIEKLIVNE